MFTIESQAQVLRLYFLKSWFLNAFEKQKQIKKQRPTLSSRLTTNGYLSYDYYLWIKISQQNYFGRDFIFLKCILYIHK